jgi:3-oxoacyl-[acyl-carrier protein] reductase
MPKGRLFYPSAPILTFHSHQLVTFTLVAEGATVTICARNRANVATAAKELGITGYACDVSNAQDIEDLLATLNRDSRRVDILVVNTGGPPQSTFASTDDAMWHSAFEALWLSSVRLIRGCVPGMLQRQRGRIILVTSISAQEPLPNLILSNAIRPGLHGLVNTLSRELARDAVTVNGIPSYQLRVKRYLGPTEREKANTVSTINPSAVTRI